MSVKGNGRKEHGCCEEEGERTEAGGAAGEGEKEEESLMVDATDWSELWMSG